MRIETIAVHAGHRPDPATGAVTPPIHLTTTFARDAEGALPHGFIYARSDNPTRRELESSLAALRGRRDRARLRVRHGGDRRRVPVAASGRARHRAAGRLLRHREAAARGDGGLGPREHAGGHDRSSARSRPRSCPRPGSSGSRPRPTRPWRSPTSRGSRRSAARLGRAASATTQSQRIVEISH